MIHAHWTAKPMLAGMRMRTQLGGVPGRYGKALANTAVEALSTGAWVAAGGLPPVRRRLVRAGIVTATAAVALSIGDRADKPSRPAPVPGELTLRQGLAAMSGVGVAVGVSVSSHLLQKRWAASLARRGHPRPHRALAGRMVLLSVVGSLPARLWEAHAQPALGGPPPAPTDPDRTGE